MFIQPENCKIIVRHSRKCRYFGKPNATTVEDCQCFKSLSVYHPEDKSQERVKTKQRQWSKAVDFRQEYLARHSEAVNKDLAELDERRTKDAIEAKVKHDQVTIESAIVSYVNRMRMDRKAPGTIQNVESQLGYTDPKSSKVLKSGKFTRWLNGIPFVKPQYLSDLSPEWIEQYVGTWKLGDRTENSQRQTLRSFFKFCTDRKWIVESPAATLGSVKERKGSRTAAFEPEQIEAIFRACESYKPEVPEAEKAIWRHRLLVFIKLMRYSGADLADVCQFQPSQLDGDLFRYRRQKSGVSTEMILLPADLAAELRSVPDACGLTGSLMPFRSTGISLKEDASKWRWRIQRVFTLAGIGTVKTDIGERLAHPKMLRDTFAIEQLNIGVDLLIVSRQLGHTSVRTTEKHYLPKSKSRNEATLALLRKAMAASQPKPQGKVVKMRKQA